MHAPVAVNAMAWLLGNEQFIGTHHKAIAPTAPKKRKKGKFCFEPIFSQFDNSHQRLISPQTGAVRVQLNADLLR